MPQFQGSLSRYIDYTSEEGGGGTYGDGYSSFDGGYGPPDRPPRRGKASDDRERFREERRMDVERRVKKNRSLERGLDVRDYDASDGRDRSLNRLDRRDRSLERLDRQERSLERLDRQERSLERLDRNDRSLERLDRQDRSLERLDRQDRSLERLDRNDRSLERLDRQDRSLERLDRNDRSLGRLDRRDTSLDRLERRKKSLERLDRQDRSLERLDRRDRDVELGRERSLERNLDKRRKNGVDRDDRSLDSLPRNDRSLELVSGVRESSSERLGTQRARPSSAQRAPPLKPGSRQLLTPDYPGQVYVHPGPASDRADSEYTAHNHTTRSRAAEEEERRAASRAASEIYASTRFPRPTSEMSQYTYRSGRHGSDVVSVKTKSTANGKLVMETMTAPHPCCPNTRSCCCLMVLLNLGLLLITLGFVVVLQLYDPPFVWYVGLSMLIFGFLVLFGSLIYCVFVCREVERLRPPPGELYWTRHWSKTVHVPEIHYSNNQTRPADYRGSEFSFKSQPSRLTNGNNTNSSLTRY